jgi:uncharacterized membrane protein
LFVLLLLRYSYLRTAHSVSKVNQQVWIALASVTIIVGSAYPVFGSSTRPGHEIFSSDKPEAIRQAQEEQRQEYRRLLKEQRDERETELAALEKAAAKSNQQ